MLGEQLKTTFNDEERILNFFSGWKGKKIRRITFFDEASYGSGINLYFMSKKDFSDPAEAYVAAWMSQYLWEEDIEETFDYSADSVKQIYNNSFLSEIEKYTYKIIDENTLKKYINLGVKPIIEKARKNQSDTNIEFLSESGIYVDKKYTLKNSYIFKPDEKIIDAVLLYKKEGLTKFDLYKELFFETDIKYAFYID